MGIAFWQRMIETYPHHAARLKDFRAKAKDTDDLVRMLKAYEAELYRRKVSDIDEHFRRGIYNLTGCDPYSDAEMALDKQCDHLLDCVRV